METKENPIAVKSNSINETIKPQYNQMCKPLPKLYPAQKDLYALICETCINGELLNTSKAFAIYKSFAKAKTYHNYYNSETKEYFSKTTEWGEWEWSLNFKNWILRSLGQLVMKGYLKIMPTIDFSELEIITHEEK